MKINMGKIDRRIRIGLAVFMLVFVIVPIITGPLAWLTIAVSLLLIGTATVRFCPLYRLTGFRTDRNPFKKEDDLF